MIDRIVSRIRLFLPDADPEQLRTLASECAEELRMYCGLDAVPEAAETVICQMTQYCYTQLGAAGLKKQKYSGMTENYFEDYPAPIRRAMQRFRRIGRR